MPSIPSIKTGEDATSLRFPRSLTSPNQSEASKRCLRFGQLAILAIFPRNPSRRKGVAGGVTQAAGGPGKRARCKRETGGATQAAKCPGEGARRKRTRAGTVSGRLPQHPRKAGNREQRRGTTTTKTNGRGRRRAWTRTVARRARTMGSVRLRNDAHPRGPADCLHPPQAATAPRPAC